MHELDAILRRLARLPSRVEVKLTFMLHVARRWSPLSPLGSSECFFMNVAFPYINGIGHPAHEIDFSAHSTIAFKSLWDRLR